ncbi:MAG: ATP-binding protein [Candidatus Kapaibacterium sp.]
MTQTPHILLARDFHTTREEISALPRLLEGIRAAYTLSDGQFFNLVVAMTEAVNNAIVHGNRLDPAKSVHYRLEARAEGIYCVVEDEGDGFDPDDIADPVSPENLMREGGRGMFLIRALMGDLQVTDTGHGTRVAFLCAKE